MNRIWLGLWGVQQIFVCSPECERATRPLIAELPHLDPDRPEYGGTLCLLCAYCGAAMHADGCDGRVYDDPIVEKCYPYRAVQPLMEVERWVIDRANEELLHQVHQLLT